MADGTCSVEGCTRTGTLKRGWCESHYARWLRTGETGSAFFTRKVKFCSVEGCGRPHSARGLCKAHQHRLERDGDIRADIPIGPYRDRGTGGVCVVDGCGAPSTGRLCRTHVWRQTKLGSPTAEGDIKSRGVERPPTTCDVAECDKVARTRQLCSGHYSRLLRTGQTGPAELRALPKKIEPGSTCSVEGCALPEKARTWCVQHYGRWQRTGDVDAARPVVLAADRREQHCTIEGCDRPIYGRGLCGAHYQRWFKTGDPAPEKPIKGRGRVCKLGGCNESHFCLDYCLLHYQRFKKYGDPSGGKYHHSELIRKTRALPSEQRFWARIDKQGPVPTWRPDLGPCWIWLGQINNGYGMSSTGKALSGSSSVHRTAWLLSGEPLIDGLELDHLCRVTACCNPDHLEQVPPWVNNMRGNSATARNRRKKACRRGHKFTPENTIVRSTAKGKQRQCRTCMNARVRSVRAARRLPLEDRRIATAYRSAIKGDPCLYCGATASAADHYFPVARGGTDHWFNLKAACTTCNSTKNAKCGTAFALRQGASVYARVFSATASAAT